MEKGKKLIVLTSFLVLLGLFVAYFLNGNFSQPVKPDEPESTNKIFSELRSSRLDPVDVYVGEVTCLNSKSQEVLFLTSKNLSVFPYNDYSDDKDIPVQDVRTLEKPDYGYVLPLESDKVVDNFMFDSSYSRSEGCIKKVYRGVSFSKISEPVKVGTINDGVDITLDYLMGTTYYSDGIEESVYLFSPYEMVNYSTNGDYYNVWEKAVIYSIPLNVEGGKSIETVYENYLAIENYGYTVLEYLSPNKFAIFDTLTCIECGLELYSPNMIAISLTDKSIHEIGLAGNFREDPERKNILYNELQPINSKCSNNPDYEGICLGPEYDFNKESKVFSVN